MGDVFSCAAEVQGPYSVQIRPVHITNIPDEESVQLRLKMVRTGQVVESSMDVTFESSGKGKRIQRWGLNEPVMDIRGEQFDSDSIDIELVGLDEKPAVPMSKFSLEKDEIVMKEVAVGDHDVKLALQ
eukprot:CAMPEP_0174331194 /NCGR_PEP_ID=MMETSP0810-20121108/17291_1 /TAXON_ID=73025 ORGANISM="Eutreptiella gymnastica-like, Strain CCMP1594" /NCGR_SAMPLE_ID=MMETSP0810 /ASSEMBLY_ACC=CAM_ASM_000659 /LENGTH=127 /DNA_ID=CAMNT_0015446833 /DNA_START=18 /DNA_END=398 /DNA_ORIENTATION=+